ncbi:MAG: PKD domain-containing protein [Candidatus Omnitrophica bacterium]|nr:PKD domain-containing protein [Candidatus Omnitrophota bacterium]
MDISVLPGAEIGSLFGTVKDKRGFPVEGALVNTVYTNIDGKYKLENIDRGKYSFSVRANGYNSLSGEIDILGGENTFDAALESTEYGNLSGVFADSIGSYLTLNPVDVAGSDACVRYAVISSEGMFEFKHLPSGLYELYTQPEDITEPIQIKEGDNVCSRLSLEQEEDLGLTPEDVEWLEVHEAEPNNDFTGANEITGNVVIIGKIYDYGDEDYFTITIDEPSILNVSVKNVTQGFRPNLKIYNPDKRPVVSTAALSGQEIEYSFEAGEPGIYYILLRDRYNTFSSQEEYSLKIEFTLGSDRYEPNPDFTSAKEIDIRKTIISTIFPAGDEDYFVIDAEEKGLLYIDMLNVPEGLRPSLKIYDFSKKLISQKGGASGEKINLDAEISQPGKHYLTVKDWYSSFSSPDAYSFKAYFIKTTDEYEPNNIKAEAGPVEFGKDYFATISVKGDNDFYKISVPDSGKVTVYIKDVPANLRPYMRLYKDPRDSYIDSAVGSAGEDLAIEFETGDPSNYFIQVQDRYNSESSFLRYRLTALYVPDDDYLSKDLAIFKQTVAVPTVTHVKNIDIEIPSIEKTGKYYLQAALRSQDSQKNYQCVERFYVSDLDDSEGPEPSPEIEVALLEDGESVFTAGDAVSFKFRVENKGAAAGKCGIGFKFMDLFEKDLSEFLEPGDKKELEVGFQLPPDTEEGLYEAVYAFNGEEHIISFKIEGVTLDVEAEFKEGVLKLRIQNTGSAENVSLFAEARFEETETKKDFTLTDSKEISFSIPGAQDRSKIYYGVYFSSGKALYLGSVLADNEEEIPNSPFKVLEARCDKESYARDESVTFKWKVNSSVPADVNLLADIVSPDSDSLEVINESIFLDEGAIFIERTFDPGFAKPGLYRLLYRFIYESSVIARGSVFFDVDGESRIDLYIDKNEYTEGENVKLEARCFSSFSLSGDLNVFLDGDEAKKKKGIDLDGYEVFDFNINVKDTGKHYLYCELLYGNESITSDKETFYVLAMPKPNYSPVLLAIGDKIVTAGEYLEFTVEATDMDGDILLYSVETMPDGAYFGPDTKKFSWQPARNQSGKYFVTFNVSDGIDSVSEKVKITVSEAEPLPPAAKPLAEPLEGKAPLEVNFSADTVSGAGNIVKYEWDFDGKGVYDFSSLESGDTMFMYSGEGDFSAALRVTDREGYANIYTAGINVESIPESPCVYLEASPLKGVSPSKVYFKGSVLSQADICKYEWDFNGDGVYDACSADSSCVVKTYTVPGDYYAELKVTNAKGLSGSQKILIQISDPKVLSIEPIFLNDRGSVPIEVGFDALVDSGAAIQKYQWDFDSDGVFDFTSTDSAKTKYTYFEPGVYAPTLRVTDQNNMASEAEKELRFGMLAAQDIRKGKISADIKKGKAPLSVKFSFDCESHAGDAKYFWDFEGDGICNMITLLPEAEHIYHDSGVYMAKVDAQLDNIFIRNCREVIYVTSGKNNNNGIVGLDTLSPSARKNIQVDKLNKVKFSDRTALVLPAGILDMDDEVDIRKLEGDEVVRAIDLTDDILCVGEYREYKFNSHDGVFDKEMTITIPYLDVDGDGFTDDNNVDELTMDAYWFDETKEEWKLLSDALVFPEENIVTVKTNHFSVFGIAGTPKENESGSGTGSDESEVDMSNCFIATAVFGTPMAEEVKILCDFRDRFLLKSTAGRNFVDFYYRHSPPVANFIKDKPLLKSPIRFTLKYLVKLIQLVL